MSQTILSNISRTDSIPYITDSLSAENNSGYISLIIDEWTEQMLYELPSLKIDIYVQVNGNMSKYNPISYVLNIYNKAITQPDGSCLYFYDLPQSFYLYVYPVFDDYSVPARNLLIQDGIEDGELWESETTDFPITLSYTAT